MAGGSPKDTHRPLAEWVVGIASAFVIAALVGFLIYRAGFDERTPARLVVLLEGIEATDEGHALRIAIENLGDTAAAAVAVSAARGDSAAPATRKQIIFDEISPHSIRLGVFIFDAPIRPEDVRLAIDGYTEP